MKGIFEIKNPYLECIPETGTSPFGDESEIEETLCNVSNLSQPSQYTEEAQKIDGNFKKHEVPSPYS